MSPTRTLEARWFRRGPVPAAVRAWSDAVGGAEAETRTDLYLPPTDAALGLKLRAGESGPAVEAKRRESVGGGLGAAPVETWAKWSFPLAEPAAPDGWTAVAKTRWRHRDGAPDAGCTLEVAALTVAGEAWWSVALEATGGDADERDRLLRRAAERWLGRPDAPALAAADAAGYPAWLLAWTAPDR